MNKNNLSIGDYIENGYQPKPIFLDESTYSKALDALVIACVDILPTHQGQIVIAKRVRHPQADWWLFGGRLRTGESLINAAKRMTLKDMSLDIDPTRLRYLTAFSAAWTKRAHEPEDNGTHTASFVYGLELSTAEVKSIKLSDEYTEFKLTTADNLLDDPKHHPALKQCVECLKANQVVQ